MTAVYTRSDARGGFATRRGAPDVAANRLAAFWRPLIDLEPAAHTAVRLRAIPVVAAWLAEPQQAPRSPFALLSVPGQRAQLLRHAGLDDYLCRTPSGLDPHLRTPGWSRLVDLVSDFDRLGDHVRALVVVHLAQLSFAGLAVRLAGHPRPTGEEVHDRYALDVARVRARLGDFSEALDVFAALAGSAAPDLGLAACFQGIGHSLRSRGDRGSWFLERGRAHAGAVSDPLALSHFHRAAALQHLNDGDLSAADDAATAARTWHDAAAAAPALVLAENLRTVTETELRIALRRALMNEVRPDDLQPDELRARSAALATADPWCVDARLLVGDGYTAAGDLDVAASWYARAGELGTGAGAVGWYRAGLALDALGDTAGAAHAMGRCLELDTTAIEPRDYLAQLTSARPTTSVGRA